MSIGQAAGWIKTALNMELGLGPRHIALDGDPFLKCRGHSLPLPRICGPFLLCQTVKWIKMPLGMEVGVGHSAQGDYVIWEPSSPPLRKRGHSLPLIFSPCLLWPNGWMDQDATWYGCRPPPRRHCAKRGPSSPSPEGAQPPSSRPM